MKCIFFFQAEDDIRNRNVTGVQTCALPISRLAQRPQVSSTTCGRCASRARSPPRQIGRASCRERVEVWVVGVLLNVKEFAQGMKKDMTVILCRKLQNYLC